MFSCPSCHKPSHEVGLKCTCGTDLTLLRQLDNMADDWFNRGLESAAAGKPVEALEQLAVCCSLRPSDAEALYVRAQLLGRIGHTRRARRVAATIRELDPSFSGLAELEAAIGIS